VLKNSTQPDKLWFVAYHYKQCCLLEWCYGLTTPSEMSDMK